MDENINTAGAEPQGKGSTGITISIIVIVLVLAFGAFYFFKQVPAPTEGTTGNATTNPADSTVSALGTQGTSTDIADIQKDINATDLSNVGTGVNNIAT